MLNNNDFMPHMMVHELNSKTNYQNFPTLGTVRTGKLSCDIYTNNRHHRDTDFVSRPWHHSAIRQHKACRVTSDAKQWIQESKWHIFFPYQNSYDIVMILTFRTDMPGQTVQTQIRLLLEEQSDQGLHFLPFRLHCLDSLLYGRAT